MKSEKELKGGIIPLLLGLAVSGAQMGIEYAMAKDQAEREAESQRKFNEWVEAQNKFWENDQRLHDEAIKREKERKEQRQKDIAATRESSLQKNVDVQQQLLDQRKLRAEAERQKQAALNAERLRQETARFAAIQQQDFDTEQDAMQRKLMAQQEAAEARNATFAKEIDQLTSIRLREQQQRQAKADEIRRLQQQAIAQELQQRQEVASFQPPQRVVAKARTTLATRRGRGADGEIMDYLTTTLKLSKKDAKKVLKSYF